MTDIIQAMKVIKLYAWEIPFKEKIAKIRDVEIAMLKNMAYYYGILASSFAITPLGDKSKEFRWLVLCIRMPTFT